MTPHEILRRLGVEWTAERYSSAAAIIEECYEQAAKSCDRLARDYDAECLRATSGGSLLMVKAAVALRCAARLRTMFRPEAWKGTVPR